MEKLFALMHVIANNSLFTTIVDLLDSHRYLLWLFVLVIGIVGIYFRLPKIKKETKGPVIPATQNEWMETAKSANKLSFYWLLASVICFVIVFFLKQEKPNDLTDSMIFTFCSLATLSAVSSIVKLLSNRKLEKIHIINK